MTDETTLASLILAYIVDREGGIIDMDAEEVLNNIKSGKMKQIKISIQNKILRLEVLDESESKDSE